MSLEDPCRHFALLSPGIIWAQWETDMIGSERSCFCCGSNKRLNETKISQVNGYSLKKCSQCSVIVAQPINGTESFCYDDYGEYLIVAAEEVRSHIDKALKSSRKLLLGIRERFGKNVDLLDFGCGAGYFVRAAAEFGFNSAGVDASLRLRSFAQDVLALQIYSELDNIKERFDVISAFDVIEHLPPENSKALMQQLLNLLKPGGIFVGNTPNISSINVRMLGVKEPVIAPPSHICYFTPASLDSFLCSLGLTRLSISAKGFNIGSFFRTDKFQPSFIEKPCGSPAKKLFLQMPLRLVGRAISAVVSGTDLGYQIHFQYMKPKL